MLGGRSGASDAPSMAMALYQSCMSQACAPGDAAGAGAPPSKFARIVGSDAASGSMGSSWTQPAPVSTW